LLNKKIYFFGFVFQPNQENERERKIEGTELVRCHFLYKFVLETLSTIMDSCVS